MSVAQQRPPDKSRSSNPGRLRQALDQLAAIEKACRELRQLLGATSPAPSTSAMRSQLPRRGFRSGPRRKPASSPTPRGRAPQVGELHGPGCRCGMCPQGDRP